ISGSEHQQEAISKTLTKRQRIIHADEPTGDLDTQTGSEVAGIMYDIARQERAAVVVVTHDPIIAVKADRLLEMRDGRISELVHEPVIGQKQAIRVAESAQPEPGRSLSQPN